MTVSELIEELKKLPPNQQIFMPNSDNYAYITPVLGIYDWHGLCDESVKYCLHCEETSESK